MNEHVMHIFTTCSIVITTVFNKVSRFITHHSRHMSMNTLFQRVLLFPTVISTDVLPEVM